MILRRLAAAAEVGLEVAVATFYWSSTRLLLLLNLRNNCLCPLWLRYSEDVVFSVYLEM